MSSFVLNFIFLFHCLFILRMTVICLCIYTSSSNRALMLLFRRSHVSVPWWMSSQTFTFPSRRVLHCCLLCTAAISLHLPSSPLIRYWLNKPPSLEDKRAGESDSHSVRCQLEKGVFIQLEPLWLSGKYPGRIVVECWSYLNAYLVSELQTPNWISLWGRS